MESSSSSTSQTSSSNLNPNANPNPPTTTSDLATAISLLKDATAAAESTIDSISSFFSNKNSTSSSSLSLCPYDPRHRMPPESLFRHSLICPSSSSPIPDPHSLLNALRYPNSLHSESSSHTPFTAADDLCFSLDDDDETGVNFFYKDCPGVVSFPEPQPRHEDSSTKTFLLPAVLSAECANFMPQRRDTEASEKIRILPSEFWAFKFELESWKDDYPTTYSHIVLRVASGLDKMEESVLKRWIISNSRRFGVLIDVFIRDHVFLLFKSCLRVIRREALSSLKSLISNGIGLSSLKASRFDCPKLDRSLFWFASQLSVLYGEPNAKFFTIGMLKQSFLCVGSNSMLFKIGEGKCRQDNCGIIGGDGVSGEGCEYSASKSVGGLERENNVKDCDDGPVLVSQIAAAIAALHERFSLEQRINGLRFSQPLHKSQLVTEYLYASTRAHEIRANRPNYRAVSEHDGLLLQRGNNQDSGKAKTREELLAEERDYKRRRTSYRGKKAKRNPTEVMRGIIEEHMEEIIRPGGIGCKVNSTAEVDVFPINQHSNDRTTQINDCRYDKYDVAGTKLDSPYSKDRANLRKDLQFPHKEIRSEPSEHQDGHKRRNHNEEKCGSRSPSIYRQCDQPTHLHELEYTRAYETKFQRKGSADNPRYKHHISTPTSKFAHDNIIQGHKHISETININRGRSWSSRSNSVAAAAGFEDRYDPSVSYDETDGS